MPAEYKDFADVFSKKKSDTLSPRRACDHKIEIVEGKKKPEGRGHLYHMPLKKLDMLRDHLQEHLAKEFIIPSKAAYTSSVLFALKPVGG